MTTALGPSETWCPRTIDEAMLGVQGLFPPGPAFHAVNIEGTTQYQYWRALADVLAYTYDRLCAYVDEFFCATVNESRDQWIEEYGLNDPCDPYGYNLCVKVAAQGGATCDAFVEMASLSGWVISCYDNSKDPEPIAGCFEIGCTPLGPTPTFNPRGSRLGYGQIGTCNYGEVVKHPEPEHWNTTKTYLASCTVPGSNLGEGPDTDESCCFIVGYYDMTPRTPVFTADFCRDQGNTITFECPRVNIPGDTNPMPVPRETGVFDDTGNYSEWGNAFVWTVTVDTAASQSSQAGQASTPNTDPSSQAGCLMAGNIQLPDGSLGGTPLCADVTAADQSSFALCFLDRIKPAHTVLNVEVLQP